MLTAARLRDVLSYDPGTGIFIWRKQLAPRGKIGQSAGYSRNGNRVSIRIDGILYLAHRLVWMYVYSQWPIKEIDHINGDQSDNRLTNLRAATRSQNMCNTKARSATGLKGITFDKSRNKWVAQISKSGRKNILKRFSNKEQACEFYRMKVLEYHGEFAFSNREAAQMEAA